MDLVWVFLFRTLKDFLNYYPQYTSIPTRVVIGSVPRDALASRLNALVDVFSLRNNTTALVERCEPENK